MYTPYEVLDRTLSSPPHFLAAYLALANTFVISTHHSFSPDERHEYAILYMWLIIFACTGIYQTCTGTSLLPPPSLLPDDDPLDDSDHNSSDPDTDPEEVRI